MKIDITIPFKIFGVRLWTRTHRRDIPSAWPDIDGSKRRLKFVRDLATLPFDTAIVAIVRDILNLSKFNFNRVDPADIAVITEQLEWMRLEPSTQPIFSKFRHGGIVYAMPKPDFVGGSAYEFAQADGYYHEWLDNPDNPEALLRLVATLARVHSRKRQQKTSDARQPLSISPQEAEHDIETRAKRLETADVAVIVAVLRYFEGVKKDVHEYGTASGLFEKNDENDPKKPKSPTENLFGWWTAYRAVAKSQSKTEEQVWQMSFWRVIAIMIEEKVKADAMEKRAEAQKEST